MPAPRPVSHVTYTLLGPGEAPRFARRARWRRLAPRALLVLLLVGLPAHAFANTTPEVGGVHTVRVPLDRDFERSFTWQGTVNAMAPAGAWVWPTLHMETRGVGTTSLRGLDIPRLEYETFVDGEPVTEFAFVGEFGRWTLSGHDGYGCAPHYACDWPEMVWGVRDVPVEIRATLTHDADTRGRGLAQEFTLGPMLVTVDRCPCSKTLG